MKRVEIDDLEPLQVVRIDWLDACDLVDGWTAESDLEFKLKAVVTVGQIVRVTPDAIFVGMDSDGVVGGSRLWHSVGAVPRVNVQTVRILR